LLKILYGQWANRAILYRDDIKRKSNGWIDGTMYASAVTECYAVSATIIVQQLLA
jgi:hypothetical protein